jgi:methylation protein EvaC
VKHLLAPDGAFIFETGYWPAIADRMLIDTIEHEHIHYFSVEPLRAFFARYGLTLMHVEEQPTKGGSLRGYVQHANGQKPEQSVSDMVASEIHCDSGTNCKDVVTRWAIGQRIGQLEKNIKARIAESGDETWVGYGAAVGSTLLLHQFGLGEKLLCLVDSNPQKQGRLSPGYHLRVVDPSELKAINPDKIVILAWRYAEMIQAQHPEFAGKWILPLPEVVGA